MIRSREEYEDMPRWVKSGVVEALAYGRGGCLRENGKHAPMEASGIKRPVRLGK